MFHSVLPTMFSKTLLPYLQFCPSWWSCCFIYVVFCRPNYELVSSLFISQPAQCDLGTVREKVSPLGPWLALNLIRSHHHRKGFFTGGYFDLFYAFHISSTLKGRLTASHLSPEPRGLTQPMRCGFSTPKNHDHLKPLAALWAGPDDLKIPQGSSWGWQGLCMWTWMWCWAPVPCCGPDHILFILSTWACWAVLGRVVKVWNWSGAMCTPAYLGIRGGNGDTDRLHMLSCCLCAVLSIK